MLVNAEGVVDDALCELFVLQNSFCLFDDIELLEFDVQVHPKLMLAMQCFRFQNKLTASEL